MILELFILFLAIPTGIIIAWAARDELLIGRTYFRILMIATILLGIWFWLTGLPHATWTLAFIFIVALTGFLKSYNKRWTKRRL